MNPTPTAANSPPLKFVIPGLIPVGLTILAGPPKGGKSWLALQIAVAADMGGEVLGICMPKLKVYYLALEDTEYRIADRLKNRRRAWTSISRWTARPSSAPTARRCANTVSPSCAPSLLRATTW